MRYFYDCDEIFLSLYQQPFIGQTPNNYFQQPRFYRNGPSKLKGYEGKPIRFGRAAHNTIKFSRPDLSAHFPEIMIIHDAPESNREERKIQRGKMNVKQLKEDLKKNEKDSRALFYLGNTYMELKDHKKAIDCYHKYQKYQTVEHSEYYQCLINEALCLKEMKENKKARDVLSKATGIDPTRRDAVQLLGDIYREEKDYDKAIKFYQQVLQIQPKPSRMFNNGAVYTWLPHQALSMCYKALGDNQKAVSHLKVCQSYANHPGWDVEIKELTGGKQNIYIVDHIGSFTKDFIKHLEGRGYDVVKTPQFDRGLAIWADAIWVEWADRNATQLQDFKDKTVIRLHGYEAYQNRGLFGSIIWDCKQVVFVADHIQSMMKGMVPSLNGQCKVIKNGVNTDKFYIKTDKRDPKNVGYAGLMNHKKNPTRLARIIKEYPDMVFNLRVDWQDPYSEETFKYETRGCENIVYHGYYEDLNDFWNQMTYVISTSDIESFSFNVAEGMAAGCEPLVYNWKGAKKIWHPDHIFDDLPDFKKDIDMEKNRDYIKQNYPLAPSVHEMERVLVV
jgi:tetratricopeptide (TPR) repeat protein